MLGGRPRSGRAVSAGLGTVALSQALGTPGLDFETLGTTRARPPIKTGIAPAMILALRIIAEALTSRITPEMSPWRLESSALRPGWVRGGSRSLRRLSFPILAPFLWIS